MYSNCIYYLEKHMYVLSQILYIFLEIEEITKNIYGWVYIGHHDSIFWQKHQVLGEIFIIYLLYISTVHLLYCTTNFANFE